jgi:hypothetical protein
MLFGMRIHTVGGGLLWSSHFVPPIGRDAVRSCSRQCWTIGDESARETRDGKRHKHLMKRFSTDGQVHPVGRVAAGGVGCHGNGRLPKVASKMTTERWTARRRFPMALGRRSRCRRMKWVRMTQKQQSSASGAVRPNQSEHRAKAGPRNLPVCRKHGSLTSPILKIPKCANPASLLFEGRPNTSR